MSKNYFLAEKAYNAYAQSNQYKSFATGNPLPVFEVLKEEIKDAWFAAAEAVVEFAQNVTEESQTRAA